MIEKLQFYNTLATFFLIAGIALAVMAAVVFLREGLKDYYMLTHRNFNKKNSGNTEGLKESKRVYKEDIVEKHTIQTPSEVLNESKEEKEEEIFVPESDEIPEEKPSYVEKTEKTDEDGDGKTDDLGKEVSYDDFDEEEDGLTGVLDEDALTGVLDQGHGPTSVLKTKQDTVVRKFSDENEELWASALQDASMTPLHHIIAVHTDKRVQIS